MKMLRSADPEYDFGQLAAWFSLLEGETTTGAGLQTYCEQEKTRITQQAAVAEDGELLGFCFDDYAYNLHTGVDRRYRGRKLAQAVKVLALRYARDELHVATVRTHHNSRNLPMLAIDRKLGYVQTPGTWLQEKDLG